MIITDYLVIAIVIKTSDQLNCGFVFNNKKW